MSDVSASWGRIFCGLMNTLTLAFGVVLMCLGVPVDAFQQLWSRTHEGSLFMNLGASGGAMTGDVPLADSGTAFTHVMRADLPPGDGVDVTVDMTEVAAKFRGTYDALAAQASKPGSVLSSSAFPQISQDPWVVTAAALMGLANVLDTRQSDSLLKGEVAAAATAVDVAHAMLGAAVAVSDAKDLVLSQQTESISPCLEIATDVIATVRANVKAVDLKEATMDAIGVSAIYAFVFLSFSPFLLFSLSLSSFPYTCPSLTSLISLTARLVRRWRRRRKLYKRTSEAYSTRSPMHTWRCRGCRGGAKHWRRRWRRTLQP